MKFSFTVSAFVLLILVILGYFSFYNYQSNLHNRTITPTSIQPSVSTAPVASSNSAQVSQLPTKYITAIDWPPKIAENNGKFNCVESGTETNRAGQTKKLTINGHIYCVTKETQGAAGSIYTQYAYARAHNGNTQIFTFSLRFVQCGNYPELEKTSCEKERQSFNVDTFIDQYIQTNH